jgi:TPR repeat protein
MARYEMNVDSAVFAPAAPTGDAFFELGMMYSTGRSVPTDLVSAHKWFNIADMRGHADAMRLRREIAEEMSDEEIAAALRAARDWLTRH